MQLPLLVFFGGLLLLFHFVVISIRIRHINNLESQVLYWKRRWQVCNTALQDSEARLLESTLRVKNLEHAHKDLVIDQQER